LQPLDFQDRGPVLRAQIFDLFLPRNPEASEQTIRDEQGNNGRSHTTPTRGDHFDRVRVFAHG